MGVEIVDQDKRDVWQAMARGAMCRCPKCGEGKLFHHRADDLPPYISIVIVGHILIGVMLEVEMRAQSINPMWYLATLVPLAIVMPLAMLPSIKGAVVGLQWANRMHGFDQSVADPALPEEDPALLVAGR